MSVISQKVLVEIWCTCSSLPKNQTEIDFSGDLDVRFPSLDVFLFISCDFMLHLSNEIPKQTARQLCIYILFCQKSNLEDKQ